MIDINLEKELNPKQLEAVTTTSGPILVIAGAGSGKTRTIVYRLAYLVEGESINPEAILLLTFTRKAAQEMMNRAGMLIGLNLKGVKGGTFHSFAYQALREYGPALGIKSTFTILDRADAEDILKQLRESKKIALKERSFPKKNTVLSLLSKARNKELPLEEVLKQESAHLLDYAEDLNKLSLAYREFKLTHNLLDYDDLLFFLEELLASHVDIREFFRMHFSHVMVDEYQDTNLVQGRLIRLLAGEKGNLMAVGDDAQSIYSFRGATVQNILNFTRDFPNTKIIKLEQNYRSCQPVLELCNQILLHSKSGFKKHLFSEITTGPKPELLCPLTDQTQANLILHKIAQLAHTYPLNEIAVLFRAGFQSYNLELALNKCGLQYKKYGGIKFTEAAHIKDVLAHLKLISNPEDIISWQRAMSLLPKIGPKTATRLYRCLQEGEQGALEQFARKHRDFARALDLIDQLRNRNLPPAKLVEEITEYYQPIMQLKFPDDHPRRSAGLEQLLQIAAGYDDLENFLADVVLENGEQFAEQDPLLEEQALTLSTVHSAKGLEWSAVLVIDLVEDRFPSRHALLDPDAMEEERRLFYVACTRAKEYLGLSVPCAIYNRYQNRSDPVQPSPFIRDLPKTVYTEFKENFSGTLKETSTNPAQKPGKTTLGYCEHKIFGRGKIIKFIPPNRYQVNFPGFGLKVVVKDYLKLEQD